MEVFGIVQALPGSAGCKKIADFAVVLVGSTAVAKAVVDSWYTLPSRHVFPIPLER